MQLREKPCVFVPGSMLKINPEERLSINELVNQLQEIAAARNVNPKSPITEVLPVCSEGLLDQVFTSHS